MVDVAFREMHDFLTEMLKERPDDKVYLDMYKDLMQKKHDYDSKVLEGRIKLSSEQMAGFFAFCMLDRTFRLQWELISKASSPQLSATISFENK